VVEEDVGGAGERTPRKVPMIPLADMVAFSTSVSNHWSRRSTALMVMSWIRLCCWERGRARKRCTMGNRRATPVTLRGSGGTMLRTGLTKRAMSAMARAYSS
jgi:hypothetical protein